MIKLLSSIDLTLHRRAYLVILDMFGKIEIIVLDHEEIPSLLWPK